MRRRCAHGATKGIFACVVAGVALALAGEVLLYDVYSTMWKWPGSSNAPPSLKMLFVSDPHIQCSFSAYEPWLFRWDADRYLKQAYSRAIRRMNPDVVVILGDLFAEGYKASSLEWADYLKCKEEILHTPGGTKLIVVPGDNDIGGEGADLMNEVVNRRYIEQFGPFNAIIPIRNVIFIKVNTPSFINPLPQGATEAAMRLEVESFIHSLTVNQTMLTTFSSVVLLSHVPLVDLAVSDIRKLIVGTLRPNYLFSGHIHHSTMNCHRGAEGTCVLEEFTVPTSSYRMGEASMGLGAATVGQDGHLSYKVLWLPPRFPVLSFYLLWAIITSVTIVTTVCCNGSYNAKFVK